MQLNLQSLTIRSWKSTDWNIFFLWKSIYSVLLFSSCQRKWRHPGCIYSRPFMSGRSWWITLPSTGDFLLWRHPCRSTCPMYSSSILHRSGHTCLYIQSPGISTELNTVFFTISKYSLWTPEQDDEISVKRILSFGLCSLAMNDGGLSSADMG